MTDEMNRKSAPGSGAAGVPAALGEEPQVNSRAVEEPALPKEPVPASPAAAAEGEGLPADVGERPDAAMPVAPKRSRSCWEAVRRAGYRPVEPGEEWYPKLFHPEAESLAARLGIPVVIEHEASGYVLALIPGGSFRMGASEGDGQADDDEKPAHEVRIRQLYVGVTPVLQRQWARVAGMNPSEHLGPRRPVTCVSWNDCTLFVESASGGRSGLRLSTEAEWEYFARAGTSTRYWWGNEYRKGMANCDETRVDGVIRGEPTVVGDHPPNPWGLLDILGNVDEWCQDDYGGRYGRTPIDGSAFTYGWSPVGGTAFTREWADCRVLRGGSWLTPPVFLRMASRGGEVINTWGPGVGVRFVRDAVFL